MTKTYKALWVTEEVHAKIKSLAAKSGGTIDEFLSEVSGEYSRPN